MTDRRDVLGTGGDVGHDATSGVCAAFACSDRMLSPVISTMMNDSVDGCGGGHGGFEDGVPLGEHQIAGDGHRPTLVALSQEREEHLHLIAVLMYVAKVIENEQVEAVESSQLLLESQVPLRCQQALNQQVGADEEYAMTT